MTEQLREAVKTCGLTRADVARESGVPESVLSRFVMKNQELRSMNLDKLCTYLGLSLTDSETPKRKRKDR